MQRKKKDHLECVRKTINEVGVDATTFKLLPRRWMWVGAINSLLSVIVNADAGQLEGV